MEKKFATKKKKSKKEKNLLRKEGGKKEKNHSFSMIWSYNNYKEVFPEMLSKSLWHPQSS